MKIKKDVLVEFAYDGEVDGWEKVEDTITDHTRWSVHHDQIVKCNNTGKFYLSSYSVGATESQMEDAYDYDDDLVDCTEVERVEVVKHEWKVVGD